MARRSKGNKTPGPKPAPKDEMPSAKNPPPNSSDDPKGYNSNLFRNQRSVRRALRRLGYKVNLVNAAPPTGIIRRFQKDYNLCSIKRHPAWGVLKIDTVAGRHTLNALEIALNFAFKKSAQLGVTPHDFWQNLCKKLRPDRSPKRGPVGQGRQYVELIGEGIGRLRRPGIDFRVRVSELARKGSLLFAKATIPSQAGHPGDPRPRWYPAIARPKAHAPMPMPRPGAAPMTRPGQ